MRINLKHGGGGKAMESLIRSLLPLLVGVEEGEVPLSSLEDAGVVDGVAFTIDSFTVSPLFFPGGDIGKLAVSGTVNDLAVIGARARAIAVSVVLEEGLETDIVKRVFASMGSAAETAGVPFLAGDTKVVEKGGVRDMIVTTAGLGREFEALERNRRATGRPSKWLVAGNIREGDRIIVTGTVGDHGATIVSARQGLGFEASFSSDVAPIVDLMELAVEANGVVSARDPTRGALAGVLNEWAAATGLGIELYEERIPVKEGVRALSSVLGIDPMELPNEGMAVLAVDPRMSSDVLDALRSHPLGRRAEEIGFVTGKHGYVVLNTRIGGRRIVERPVGDPVPRIC